MLRSHMEPSPMVIELLTPPRICWLIVSFFLVMSLVWSSKGRYMHVRISLLKTGFIQLWFGANVQNGRCQNVCSQQLWQLCCCYVGVQLRVCVCVCVCMNTYVGERGSWELWEKDTVASDRLMSRVTDTGEIAWETMWGRPHLVSPSSSLVHSVNVPLLLMGSLILFCLPGKLLIIFPTSGGWTGRRFS